MTVPVEEEIRRLRLRIQRLEELPRALIIDEIEGSDTLSITKDDIIRRGWKVGDLILYNNSSSDRILVYTLNSAGGLDIVKAI